TCSCGWRGATTRGAACSRSTRRSTLASPTNPTRRLPTSAQGCRSPLAREATMAQQVDLTAVHDLLVEAIASEHRLYQAAVEARADGERWSARATLAHRKEAMD